MDLLCLPLYQTDKWLPGPCDQKNWSPGYVPVRRIKPETRRRCLNCHGIQYTVIHYHWNSAFEPGLDLWLPKTILGASPRFPGEVFTILAGCCTLDSLILAGLWLLEREPTRLHHYMRRDLRLRVLDLIKVGENITKRMVKTIGYRSTGTRENLFDYWHRFWRVMLNLKKKKAKTSRNHSMFVAATETIRFDDAS